MNRLLVLIAAVGVTFIAVGSTCFADPIGAGAAAASNLALGSGVMVAAAPSELVGKGMLSL